MRDYWVVTLNWDIDYGPEYKVLGVYLSEQVAKKEFKKMIKYSYRPIAKNLTYHIFKDSDNCFDTGRVGDYRRNHICVSLIKVTNRKWGRKTD